MPLPPSEESDELSATEEPKLKFSFVECLMFAFHQMARRCPNFLADEANAERLKDFKLRSVVAAILVCNSGVVTKRLCCLA